MTFEPSASGPLDTDSGPGLRGVGQVTLGGTAGTLARYLLDAFVGDAAGLPFGIFVVNITGAFLLGVLIETLVLGGPDRGRRRDLRLLLGAGFLGGYTTYSLLATDTAQLLIDARVWAAIGYGLATIIAGGLASWIGILAAKTLGARS